MSNFQGHQERNPCQRSETIRHRSSWNIRRQRVTRREIRVNGLKLSPAKNTIRIYPGHQERNPCQRSETSYTDRLVYVLQKGSPGEKSVSTV